MTNQPPPLPQVSREELKPQADSILADYYLHPDPKKFRETVDKFLALFDQHLQVAVNEAENRGRINELDRLVWLMHDSCYSIVDESGKSIGRKARMDQLKNQPNTPNNDKDEL